MKNVLAFIVAFVASFAFAQFGGIPGGGTSGAPGAAGPAGAGLDGGPISLPIYTTAGLPDASAAGVSIAYNSTLTQPTFSNGSAWVPMGKEFLMSVFHSANSPGTNVVVAETRMQNPGTVRRLTSTVDHAGTGAGTYTVEVFDLTTTTSLCTSIAISCTGAVGSVTGKQCTGAAFAQFDDIDIRITDVACGQEPALNIIADVGGF